jgi:hypothetical protein
MSHAKVPISLTKSVISQTKVVMLQATDAISHAKVVILHAADAMLRLKVPIQQVKTAISHAEMFIYHLKASVLVSTACGSGRVSSCVKTRPRPQAVLTCAHPLRVLRVPQRLRR